VFSVIRRFARRVEASDDGGQTLVEYTVILVLVAVLAVTALEAIGLAVTDLINDAAAGFGGA
jgi:Flp pilus assembly pilin Flp